MRYAGGAGVELTCVQCEQSFTLTPGEQAFFESLGYTWPKRCGPCRAVKRRLVDAQRAAEQQRMKAGGPPR